MLIHARNDRWGYTSSVVREELYRTSRLFGNLTGTPVQWYTELDREYQSLANRQEANFRE